MTVLIGPPVMAEAQALVAAKLLGSIVVLGGYAAAAYLVYDAVKDLDFPSPLLLALFWPVTVLVVVLWELNDWLTK